MRWERGGGKRCPVTADLPLTDDPTRRLSTGNARSLLFAASTMTLMPALHERSTSEHCAENTKAPHICVAPVAAMGKRLSVQTGYEGLSRPVSESRRSSRALSPLITP